MGPTALLPLRRKARWGFFHPKNPTGLNPRTWVPKDSTLTSRPPKPLIIYLVLYLCVTFILLYLWLVNLSSTLSLKLMIFSVITSSTLNRASAERQSFWNCAAPKWFHSSQSPGTPLTFSRSDEGSNYYLEESKHFCTEITTSSVKHDLIYFHKPWNTAEILCFVQNRWLGIQPFFTQERASLNNLIKFGRSKETVSCICMQNKGCWTNWLLIGV